MVLLDEIEAWRGQLRPRRRPPRALDAMTPTGVGRRTSAAPQARPPLIFRKGLDLKHEVARVLADSYHSRSSRPIKADDYRYQSGRLTVHLAREFGFCYGVDRAVDYAYQARKRSRTAGSS